MNVDDVARVITKVLEDLQRNSGRPCGSLTATTTPIGDLAGFDSLSGIEATVMIETTLGRTFKTDNVLVQDTAEGRRALTVGEAASQIVKLMASQATP
ncbi:MAG TPA: hypothetical protein VK762_22785 [Polyangiaceae bacterium]|nr:hypothetical protein [Polyangiaceae bacterium]